MFIIYFSRKGSKTWRCGESWIGGGHEGEKEGRDSLGRTQEHSVTLSHSLRATQIHMFMPVFWQGSKGPADSIYVLSHLIVFMLSPPHTHTFTHFCSLSTQPKTCLHIQYTKRDNTLKFLFTSSTHKVCLLSSKIDSWLSRLTFLIFCFIFVCCGLWALIIVKMQHLSNFKVLFFFKLNFLKS